MFKLYLMKYFSIIKYCFVLIALTFMSSCSNPFSKDTIVPNESAVLSGPPLAIPPDFDLEQPTSATGEPSITFSEEAPGVLEDQDDVSAIATFESFSGSEENAILNQQEYSLEYNEIQNFETYNPNVSKSFSPQQIKQSTKETIKRKRLVPSDSYDFLETRVSSNKVQKPKRNSFGFSQQNSKNLEENNTGNLSRDEENLLQDLLD